MIDAPPRVDQDDLPDLFPELREVAPDGWRGSHAYVRKPDGWISTAPMTIGNKRDYEGRGFRYLLEYGEFIMSPPGGIPLAKDAKEVPWNPFVEPWRKILQMGGAKEFPVDQVVAMKWHIRPPYRGVEFPQITMPVHDFQCPECQKVVVFSSTNRLEAARQLRVHLVSGIDEQHKYTVADLKSYGEEIRVDFASRRTAQAQHSASAQVIDVDLKEATNPAFKCALCEWAPLLTDPVPAASLGRHKKSAHAKE